MKNTVRLLAAFILCLSGFVNSKDDRLKILFVTLFLAGIVYKIFRYIKRKKEETKVGDE